MDIIFPENTGQLPQVAKRPLRFSHVLALVYCFGGVSGVLAILSKFVTTPLFEELTYERSLFANEARQRLVELNALMSGIVSKVPSTESIRTGYVSAIVHAGEQQSPKALAPSSERVQQMEDSLRELRQLIKSTDPDESTFRQVSLLTSQSEELSKYARSLQYAPVPGTFLPQNASLSKADDELSLGEAVLRCKNEIRSLKGSLLSS